MTKQTIIAIDLETTGLEPTEGRILEIQAYELDDELEIVSSFHGILADEDKFRFLSVPIYIMHSASGLLDEKPDCGLYNIYKYLSQFKDIMVLGSNPNFDRSWILHHIPELKDNFSFRTLDVNIFYRLCPEIKSVLGDKPTNHRANDDILYSIKVARIIKAMVKTYLTSPKEIRVHSKEN